MFHQVSWIYVGSAVSKPPERHESSWGSPAWCIQKQVCGLFTIASVWVCNFKEKQQSIYSSFSSNPCLRWDGGSIFTALSDGCAALQASWLLTGFRTGWTRRAVRSSTAHPSLLLSLLLLPSCFFLSPAPFLPALRCVSSCAGPGGLTERNTCREQQSIHVRNIHPKFNIYTQCGKWDTWNVKMKFHKWVNEWIKTGHSRIFFFYLE